MKRRTGYTAALTRAAGRCDIDAPRTPYAAAKERQQRRYSLISYSGRTFASASVAGEGLPISTTYALRSW